MRRTVRTQYGPITYELIKTGRSSLELKVLPQEIRLFAPARYPLRDADRFVLEKADWIRDCRSRIDAYKQAEENLYPMTDGMAFPLEGEQAVLRLLPDVKPRADFAEGVLTLSGGDLSPDGVRERLRAYLIDLARERIEERLEYYIPLIGRRPGRVAIREQRTRWGSCSAQGNLNFNWKLIMAPKEALDYVVIHELCHLYEFNHSPRFWARVERYQSEYAQWRDFLRSGWAHPYR